VRDISDNDKTGESIQITVRFLANLSTYAPAGNEGFTIKVHQQETVTNFLERFNIPMVLRPVVVINGRPANSLTQFSNDDSVLIYEPVTGG